MRIIHIDSSIEDSFKYTIPYALHYYDIFHHIEGISKLKQCEILIK